MSSEGTFKIISGLWWTLLVCGYLAAGLLLSSKLEADRLHAEQSHEARMSTTASEAGYTAAETISKDQINGDRVTVESGVYIDRIYDMSISGNVWYADFYIWFRWQGEGVEPGKNFQMVDGEIISKELAVSRRNGNTFYELYRVHAQVTKFFNISRFPLDDHLLTIKIEDTQNPIQELVFVADIDGSAVSSRVKIPGYSIYDTNLIAKDHSYKTRRGDPNLPVDFKATYSQLIYGIWIEHSGPGLYFKMFLGGFAAVSIAMLSFFIDLKSISNRFSIGVGTFFASVANTYLVSQQVPKSSLMGLSDFISQTILISIFLMLLSSVIIMNYMEKVEDKRLLLRFDKVSFAIFATGIVAIMLAISNAANR